MSLPDEAHCAGADVARGGHHGSGLCAWQHGRGTEAV